VYDYGAGGVWTYLVAASADEIKSRYPLLEVLEELPSWLDKKRLAEMKIRTVDVDDAADPFLEVLRAEKQDNTRPGQ